MDWYAAPFFVLVLFLFFSRCAMIRSYRVCRFVKYMQYAVPAVGALQDACFVSGFYIAAYLFAKFEIYPYVTIAVCAGAVVCVMLMELVDTIICHSYISRFDFAVLQNMNVISIVANSSRIQKICILPAAVGICFAFYAIYVNMSSLSAYPAAYMWMLWLVFFCGMAALKLGKGKWLNKAYYKKTVEGYADAVLTFASNTFLRNVMASTVLNAYRVYKATHVPLRVSPQRYTADEQAFLGAVGLLGGASSAPREDAVLFRRIVIVMLESVALRYLHAHNLAIPKQATPFLNHLAKGYPSLGNYYCSLLPTVNAMYAMLASRLDILEGKPRDSTSYETLFSLLRARGYLTYMVRGTTASYCNHAMFYPTAYKCDRLVADEDIARRNPGGLRNGWGFDDAEVYAHTIAMLEQHRDSPICTVVNTINTHPPYTYNKYAENAFPEIIQRLPSALLRSLYQMDSDLCFFFGALMEKNLLDDETLIVVCGDHTPGYGPEYQQFTRAADFFPERVPMIFVSNKSSPLQCLNTQLPACSLDFLPTMCDALGLPCPDSAWGRSMFCGGPRSVVRRHNMIYRFESKDRDISLNVQEPDDNVAHTALVKWISNMRAR